jgi:hypothetical protein
MVITSFTPTTGYTSGGTTVTITGTGLDVVTSVLMADTNVAGTIVGTPTATTVVFKTPAHAIGTPKVTVSDGNLYVTSSGSFAYTAAPTSEVLVSTTPKKFRIDVNTGTFGSPVWVKIRGIVDFKPNINTTTQDDSDYDSGAWGSDAKTQVKWVNTLTVKRGLGVQTGVYDPGQEVLRAAAPLLDAAGAVDVRWYDRKGGPEAYRGTAIVSWAPQGGSATALDTVQITLNGQGAPTTLANPVIADPTLAA